MPNGFEIAPAAVYLVDSAEEDVVLYEDEEYFVTQFNEVKGVLLAGTYESAKAVLEEFLWVERVYGESLRWLYAVKT